MTELQTEAPPAAPAKNRWMQPFVFFLIGAVVGDLAGGSAWTPRKDRKGEITAVLTSQQAAWNRGDLEAFMDSYWKSERLTFCSGGEITNGWQATYDRYKRRYQSDGKEMGQLSFSDVEVMYADDRGAATRGRYQLLFRDGKKASGRYTLVFRRLDDSWKIVHDHTSADPPSP